MDVEVANEHTFYRKPGVLGAIVRAAGIKTIFNESFQQSISLKRKRVYI